MFNVETSICLYVLLTEIVGLYLYISTICRIVYLHLVIFIFSGEARCRYIFRYFDKNHDGKLLFDEFFLMVKDIRSIRGASVQDEDVRKEASESAKVFETNDSDQDLSMSDFLTAVGQLKFRGTSMLLRNPKSVKDVLGNKTGEDSISSSNGGSGESSPKVKRPRRTNR